MAIDKMDGTFKVTISNGSYGSVTFAPQEMSVGIQDVDYDSGRAADGTMHRNKVATKRKFNFTLKPMGTAELMSILTIIENNPSFTATCPDPSQESGYYTGTFYRGDISCPAYNLEHDIWNQTTFNIIEF